MGPQHRGARSWSALRLSPRENEPMFCTQQIKTLTPLERSRLISFGIRELAWFLLRIESLHSHYGQISCFIPRVEFKEMENKPLMETIVEEDRKSKQKSNKLKDQPDKEEGIPGRSWFLGIICLSLLLMSQPILLRNSFGQNK